MSSMGAEEVGSRRSRELILAAVQAGRYERAFDPNLERAILDGEDVPFDRIDFDSLAWMEFCISVELNCGLELTPAHVEEMRSTGDVERWLVKRGVE